MQFNILSKTTLNIFCSRVFKTLLLAVALQAPAFSQQFNTIFNFNGTNGANPDTGLVIDKAGNLYGINEAIGTFNLGSVFKLSPPVLGHTTWTRTTLVNFNGKNGQNPSAGLVIDPSGNLYGSTAQGGLFNFGTVFKLSPPNLGHATWTRTTLINFNGINGAFPSGIVADASGNLYGSVGDKSGASLSRTIFKLTPPSDGHTAWLGTNLITFEISTGGNPFKSLVVDPIGNIYGTSYLGGTSDLGLVFKLTPPASGQSTWTRSTLVNFNGANGAHPYSGLILDSSGNIYGTTPVGGVFNLGTVFKLTPPTPGHSAWTRTTLVNFNSTNGSFPEANLTFDSTGNLYGATVGGGLFNLGTIFRLSPPTIEHTAWIRTTLINFNGANGINPTTGVIFDSNENLFGTTQNGGAFGLGTVFKITK